MDTSVAHIPWYMAASTLVLIGAIYAASAGRRSPAVSFWRAALLASAISVCGILLGKFGENFGLPWQIYYTVPALATIVLPPLVFRFSLWRTLLYLLLAFAAAPLVHAAFFYGLGWDEYMPFLRLPR